MCFLGFFNLRIKWVSSDFVGRSSRKRVFRVQIRFQGSSRVLEF